MNQDEVHLQNLTALISQTKNQELREQFIHERNMLLHKLGIIDKPPHTPVTVDE